jgi:lipopolysaccharide transport system permease protein
MKKEIIKITKDNIRNISIFSELFKYRKLIFIIFNRDFKSNYKQTLLGPLWVVLNPVITSLVFSIVFSKVGKISTDKIVPFLFYFSALTIWNLFQNNTIQISNFYNMSTEYFKKLYFPRLIVPLAYLLNNSIRFLIQFFILLIFCYFIYDIKVELNFLSLSGIIFIYFYCSLLSLGIGLIINSFSYIYKDLNYFIIYGLTVWMYLSPIAYPVSQAPLKLQTILFLNPMTSIIEFFRFIIFGIGSHEMTPLIISILIMLLILFLGFLSFIKTEKNFVDIV